MLNPGFRYTAHSLAFADFYVYNTLKTYNVCGELIKRKKIVFNAVDWL